MSRDYTKKSESRGIRIREAGMAHNQLGEGTTAEILALRARVAELEEEKEKQRQHILALEKERATTPGTEAAAHLEHWWNEREKYDAMFEDLQRRTAKILERLRGLEEKTLPKPVDSAQPGAEGAPGGESITTAETEAGNGTN